MIKDLSWEKSLTFSNFLSFLRVLLVIPAWILLDNFQEESVRYMVIGLGVAAAVTDVLDGYFARKFDQVSELGKIIDPLADKLFVGAVVLRLFLIDVLDPTIFYMIILRDILIFVGGLFVSMKLKKVLPSNVIGKASVVIIGFYLLVVLLNVEHTSPIYYSLYWLAFIFIIISFIVYVARAVETIRNKKHEIIQKP
jgi:CDP-diacylglycerol--glycerol-3-phosphate 3-phosphatidyltransferase